jgi:hypothetical protein
MDLKELTSAPPVAGAAAILLGLALFWLGAIINSFQHFPGLSARARLVRFFEPGEIQWALALVVAVGLLALARRERSEHGGGSAKTATMTTTLLMVAFYASAAVAAAAAINVVVELTFLGDSPDLAGSAVFQALAAIPIAGAAGWWAMSLEPKLGQPGRR